MKKLNSGDRMLLYSPKTSLNDGAPLRAFTAIATIADEKIYQAELADDFKPYWRNAIFEDCKEVKIEPLIERLDFIKNKKSRGYMFRFGLFEINQRDFELIYSHMKK